MNEGEIEIIISDEPEFTIEVEEPDEPDIKVDDD